MLKGFVNQYDEPIVPIELVLRSKPQSFQAIIDTGFNGYLNVPKNLVHGSTWYFAGIEEYEIATGERVKQQVYIGNVLFDQQLLQLYIVTSNSNDILIGTKLLKSKILEISFRSKKVIIH